jgi:hypothetical protein
MYVVFNFFSNFIFTLISHQLINITLTHNEFILTKKNNNTFFYKKITTKKGKELK